LSVFVLVQVTTEGRRERDPETSSDPDHDVVGYSRAADGEEERTLARIRGLGVDLLDPGIAAHHGRIVKRTGDGVLIEFRAWSMPCATRSRCRRGFMERNADLPPDRRVGIHLGDVVGKAGLAENASS
jgi:adenylate cyclase